MNNLALLLMYLLLKFRFFCMHSPEEPNAGGQHVGIILAIS